MTLHNILDISFNLADYFKISPFSFDHVDYYEFHYQVEQLQELLKNKQNDANGEQDISALFNG